MSEKHGLKGRFSARKKVEAVLRLLRGEDLDVLSRELGGHRSPAVRVARALPRGRRREWLAMGKAA